MTENQCPKCDSELEWDGAYHCGSCSTHYKKIGYCPECSAELEKLQACGSASYFCNTCNELKSKSRVSFVLQPILARD
ncbi:zinc ribbon domain-containing protein [Vibrio paucivorans]